ncbi:cell division protein ZapE [Pseudomonas sp. MPFS]|uniref:cell division protein ZapE n=1 Tax=Pseudomonas sp. MPFS TaxID=2795724 RepID=UPI001F141665|nr:cell division protein ZapE [Pseudomonas sp. MPFS]UMZ09960.1 cell division protein ZapE [Pseudomonas sp. MPFS]
MAALPPTSTSTRSLWQRWFARNSRQHGHGAQLIHDYFHHKAQELGYTLGQGQLRVIDSLASQAQALLHNPHQLQSLYLYGAVGRGKSWLLDGFFRALPIAEKQRLHFHDFFTQLHQGMFRHQQRGDTLEATLDELLEECRVLCFDEFHVHDIGDAMLISRLFKALFKRGILLLVTSNYAPEGLLPNPLYHARFKPVIDLINARMQVLEVGGDQDYRTQARTHDQQAFTRGQYIWPGTQAQRQALQLPERHVPATLLPVGSRQLSVRQVRQRSIRFEFADLCEQPTAVMDYLELSRRFDTWIIDELPDLQACSIAAQQRFVNLIDVLYDQDKQLLLIGQRPLTQSLGGQAVDLARTRSRLGQLQQIGPEPVLA